MKRTFLNIMAIATLFAAVQQAQAMHNLKRLLPTAVAAISLYNYAAMKPTQIEADTGNAQSAELPNKINEDQMRSFLQRWPLCNSNRETKSACAQEMASLAAASPRVMKDSNAVIEKWQIIPELAGIKSDEARKITETDLSTFLKMEYAVDASPSIDSNKYPELAKFYKKYGLPRIYSTHINEHKDKISGNSFTPIYGLPHLFLKNKNIERVINAERMRNYIAQHNLDRWDVAKKYVMDIDGEIFVIAENINPQHKMTTIEDVKQFKKIIEDTRFSDAHPSNWSKDASGKSVFIDTEDRSFFKSPLDFDITTLVLKMILESWLNMDAKAKAWIRNESAKSHIHTTVKTPLDENKRYDAPDIDFEKVQEEYDKYREEKSGQ